jgi:ATP-dependent RNA helicase DeaD
VEVLNNVQLEGRRINVEISKNGGGRRDHNGRSSGGFGGGRSSAPRREALHQEEGSGGFEATETQLEGGLAEEAQLQEKVVLAEEVQLRARFFNRARRSESFGDHDQEDQEETNIYC